jgi:hypothetical protein
LNNIPLHTTCSTDGQRNFCAVAHNWDEDVADRRGDGAKFGGIARGVLLGVLVAAVRVTGVALIDAVGAGRRDEEGEGGGEEDGELGEHVFCWVGGWGLGWLEVGTKCGWVMWGGELRSIELAYVCFSWTKHDELFVSPKRTTMTLFGCTT